MAGSRANRRQVLVGLIGAVSLPMSAGTVLAAANRTELVYVGMHGGKIHAARFDAQTGDLTMIGPVADNLRPTWALRHPTLPVIYYNEQNAKPGTGQGSVQVLRVNRRTGALALIADVRAGGDGTTHLWFDRPSGTLLAANYAGGNLAALPVRRDGTIGEVASLVQFVGSGPHPRQASPHAHGVSVDPSGKWILVTDLGADRIWILPFDRKSGKIGAFDAKSANHIVVPPGTGPRHMAWHPSGRFVYVANELTATVDTFGWNRAAGLLTKLQGLSTDAPGFAGTRSAAEIEVSKDGRFVYVSNRGDHRIVAHRIDPETGMLTQIQRIASGGPWPWHFTIHASGRWMLVANRDSDSVNVLAIDRASGMLRDSGKSLTTPKPVHVLLSGL